MYKRAIEDPEGFWLEQVELLTWFTKPTKAGEYVRDTKARRIGHTWFADGELNASYNCLDRHPGTERASNEGGRPCIKKPWSGMMRTMWGDHERFIDTYFAMFPHAYFTGDGCRIDSDGDYWLMGRIDDVVNVSGHRIGTAEVESALVSHDKVAEAAVAPMPHEIKGQALYAFVTLRDGVSESEELKKELILHVRKEIGPIATPEVIQFAPALPKTRSGKIMRRILRKIAEGVTDREALGDTTTLADPSIVERLIAGRPT